MSDIESVIPERPTFTPNECCYGMTLDFPIKDKLKPCPFCGNAPAMCHSKYDWFVMCPNCKTTSDNYSDEELARANWNRREQNA